MKIVLATMLVLAATGVAHAIDSETTMVVYSNCWSDAVRTYMERSADVTAAVLAETVRQADSKCQLEQENAGIYNDVVAMRDMRSVMMTDLYEANPVPDLPPPPAPAPVTAKVEVAPMAGASAPEKPAEAEIEEPEIKTASVKTFDPSKVDLYKPKNPNAVFNKSSTWLCVFPTDVGKYRNLMAAGEYQAALQMPGCVTLYNPVEAVQTDSIGDDLIQVTVIKDNQTVDLWGEKNSFRSRQDWLIMECQWAGLGYSECYDMTRDK
jgi:hypothetical protein